MATTTFTLNSSMASSISEIFAFPSPPASSIKPIEPAHARQPTQASFQSSETSLRAAMPYRKAAPLPLPNFIFPLQSASPSKTKDKPLSPPAASRHHRRSHAISGPKYNCSVPGHGPLSALPKHLVSRPPQMLHHPHPQRESSHPQFRVGEEQLSGHDDGLEHIPRLDNPDPAYRHSTPAAYDLLFSPEPVPGSMESLPIPQTTEGRPPCPRSIWTYSATTLSTTTSSCPTLIPDYSPLPTPDALIDFHNPMDFDRLIEDAEGACDDISQDFETFKRSLAARLDITTIMEDEEDDDDFWQCRGFAVTQDEGKLKVMKWMRNCDETVIMGK